MQMPRNGFDSLAAIARLNTDSTLQHRERWPSLAWVWDELDELRENAIDPNDHAALEKELEGALDERATLEKERDDLQAAAEQRDVLSTAIRLLLEPEPDMERVQAVLMGGW